MTFWLVNFYKQMARAVASYVDVRKGQMKCVV